MLSGVVPACAEMMRALAAATAAAAAATSSACKRSVAALNPLNDIRVERAAGAGIGSYVTVQLGAARGAPKVSCMVIPTKGDRGRRCMRVKGRLIDVQRNKFRAADDDSIKPQTMTQIRTSMIKRFFDPRR